MDEECVIQLTQKGRIKMREIKFRGFSVLFNEWIYGVGLKYDRKGKPQIYVDTGWYEVVEGSESQFIGFKDKNQHDIYEKDIVKCFRDHLSEVSFRSGAFGLMTNGVFDSFLNVGGYCEVIGNSYENAELINKA